MGHVLTAHIPRRFDTFDVNRFERRHHPHRARSLAPFLLWGAVLKGKDSPNGGKKIYEKERYTFEERTVGTSKLDVMDLRVRGTIGPCVAGCIACLYRDWTYLRRKKNKLTTACGVG